MKARLFPCIALLALGCAGAAPPARDPVTSDPEAPDLAYPAALVGTPVQSAGSRMNGIVYVAQGAGPHPVAIVLHGLPGEERNLDLAQALRRAGWTALFFHYRGAWGSEGSFSLGHAREDVAAAVALASSDAFARAHRADPSRIALVGHSMGGFLALLAGSELAAVDCVASISGANLGLLARLPEREAEATAQRLDALTAPLHGTSGEALMTEIQQARERFDLTLRAPALADKPLLLVAGSRDAVTPIERHHAPLVAGLERAGARSLTTRVLDADHAYSPRRIALARELVDWLGRACREPDVPQ